MGELGNDCNQKGVGEMFKPTKAFILIMTIAMIATSAYMAGG